MVDEEPKVDLEITVEKLVVVSLVMSVVRVPAHVNVRGHAPGNVDVLDHAIELDVLDAIKKEKRNQ